jgi:hypothetical protein
MNDYVNFIFRYKKDLDFIRIQGNLVGEWANVFEHCLTEGMVAEILGTELQLSDCDTLVRAAILHDWFKRHEREAVKIGGATQYDKAAIENGLKLQSANYSERIIELTQSVGHTSLMKIMTSDDFTARLMHYIDDITYNNNVVVIDERMDNLESADRYKELNESGRNIFSGRTYFQIQRSLAHKIEQDIAIKLNIKDQDVVPLVQTKLAKYKPI